MSTITRRVAVCTLACLTAAPTLAVGKQPQAESGQTPLAIKGFDPVAYFTLAKAVRGRAELELEWDDRRYRFSSATHRERFRADPLRYAPQFPDFCAMSLTRGEVVEADPENWLIADGKLYMFGKPVGPKLFRERLAENVERANRHGPLLSKP
jgi:YHS domain-containing protein